MKKVILCSPNQETFIETFIPNDWVNYVIVPYTDFKNFDFDKNKHQIYPIGDDAYNIASSLIDDPKLGFCKKLADLCNNKFIARETLDCLKDIPFTICKKESCIVEWFGDKDDKLIAKPVNGTGSKGIQIVKEGDKLDFIDEDYIIELYIDDNNPRLFVNGYLSEGKVDILMIGDSNYHLDESKKLDNFSYPSKFIKNPFLYHKICKKYLEVMYELHKITGCDNQIIDIEFFIVGQDVLVMEVNPRVGVNHLPIFESMSGYQPLKVMESLYNYTIPKKISEPKNYCICSYFWNTKNLKKQSYSHKINENNLIDIFTVFLRDDLYHTYITSDIIPLDLLNSIVNDTKNKIN